MTMIDKLKAIWNITKGQPTAYKISIKNGMLLNGLAIDVSILDGDIVIDRLIKERQNGGIVKIGPGTYNMNSNEENSEIESLKRELQSVKQELESVKQELEEANYEE